MSATSGRDVILRGELQGNLDAKGFKIINADLTDASLDLGTIPTISSAQTVLKGDGTGNAIAAVAKADFWDTTVFVGSGASHAKGLVPDPGATAGTTKFLREDGNFVVPSGSAAPSIASTALVLKGDGAGNAVAATALTDYWNGTVMVASGASHAKGLVPDTPSSSGTSKYLREDGTWVVPPAASGVTIASTTNVIKGDNAGGGIAATPGTDYQVPSTALTRLTASTTALSGASPAVNWATTTSFSWTLSANATPTFTNDTDGWDITVRVTNPSTYTLAWPAAVEWAGGTQPTQSITNKTDLFGFKRTGTVISGAVIQNLS